MNKVQAKEMINKGVKVTHTLFTNTEWIKKHPKGSAHYLDEQDNVIGINDFWKYRTGPKWDKDWGIYLKQ